VNLDQLDARASAMGHLAAYAGIAAGVAAMMWILVLQPGAAGPVDVQIPTTAPVAFLFAAGSRIAGGPIAALQAALGTLLMLASALAIGCALWALAKKRKALGRAAFAFLVGINLFHPVSPPMQPDPPKAVDVAKARKLVGLEPGKSAGSLVSPDPAIRYIVSQIAWIEGDRDGARRLSAGLNAAMLESPIEASFRLQFLQSKPVVRSSVCTTSGCLPAEVRAKASLALAALTLLLAAAAAAGWAVRRHIGARCRRLAELSMRPVALRLAR